MEIKFWDKEKHQYEMDTDRFVVDEDFQCWEWCDIKDDYVYAENVTAHFYLNGVRVA